jgi:Right handed beta helix region
VTGVGKTTGMILRRLTLMFLTVILFGGIASLAAGIVILNRTPREIAPYIVRRAINHNPAIVTVADMMAAALILSDRLTPTQRLPPDWIGAAPTRAGADLAPLRTQEVNSIPALRVAIANAHPGDLILLQPGIYRVGYPAIVANTPGTALAPIVVRATRPGAATIEAETAETFKVAAPNWHFENLHMIGVCGDDSYCEHAFHIVGAAHDTVIRNSWLQDFNAEIKINAEDEHIPDHGLIEDNTFIASHSRKTENPVTPINLDVASDWLIRHNLISDFTKGEGNLVSYGAFAKSAGSHNIFERNVVLCEHRLQGAPGQRIGLSLGGGGSDPKILRDHGQSGTEQIGSVIRYNLIAFCSDDGIYLNKAANSLIANNTLIDTAGIDVRFSVSSARIKNNIVDGIIRTRDGAQTVSDGNITAPLLGLFVGWHGVRGLFRDPAALELDWRRSPPTPQPIDGTVTDLCGATATIVARPGAFDDFAACAAGQ